MDILVSIPSDQEEHVKATKLNPASGLTHGYWVLSGHPRFAKRGDRIWFALDGEVIASAEINCPKEEFDLSTETCDPPEEDSRPAVEFLVRTVTGHFFSVPGGIPRGFRGFRYVRRAKKYVDSRRTTALKLVGAKEAQKLHPRNW